MRELLLSGFNFRWVCCMVDWIRLSVAPCALSPYAGTRVYCCGKSGGFGQGELGYCLAVAGIMLQVLVRHKHYKRVSTCSWPHVST